jgi:hypothetical protein
MSPVSLNAIYVGYQLRSGGSWTTDWATGNFAAARTHNGTSFTRRGYR